MAVPTPAATMPISKTDKARAELAVSRGELSRRQRTLLVLADGRRSTDELLSMVDGAESGDLRKLLEQGYLRDPTIAPIKAPVNAATPTPAALALLTESPNDHERRLRLSTVATRVFLLNMIERVVSPSDHALRQRLRVMLGTARDEQALIATTDQLLIHLGAHAGAQRAASVRQDLIVDLEHA